MKAQIRRKPRALVWHWPWIVTLPNGVVGECESWGQAMEFVADFYRGEPHCSCFACNPGRVAR